MNGFGLRACDGLPAGDAQGALAGGLFRRAAACELRCMCMLCCFCFYCCILFRFVSRCITRTHYSTQLFDIYVAFAPILRQSASSLVRPWASLCSRSARFFGTP